MIKVEMPYTGGDLSVNRAYERDGRHMKKHVRNWQLTLMGLVRQAVKGKICEGVWHVSCSGHFKNQRSAPDLSNLAKVCMDAIAAGLGIDDKNLRWQDGLRLCGDDIEEPRLEFTIWGEEDEALIGPQFR